MNIQPYNTTEKGLLYHGNCHDIMKQLDIKPDVIITDPPYDKYTHAGGRFGKEKKFGDLSFECIENYDFIGDWLEITKRWVVVFCPVEALGKIQQQYSDFYIRGGIWDRINPSPQLSGDRPAQAVEGIAILHNKHRKQWNGGGRAGIWRYSVEFGCKVHETQKPLGLIRQLVEDFSNKGELIADPFFGSGTLGVAAEGLNRNWIGIEIDQSNCDKAIYRLQNEIQYNLFEV